MEQTEKESSTKYIVLYDIFKRAWEREFDVKEEFMAWFREDKKERLKSEQRIKELESQLESGAKYVADEHLVKRIRELESANQLIIGEFTGSLKGIVAWDIPKELKDKLDIKIKELEGK
jgi:hypothetical protein